MAGSSALPPLATVAGLDLARYMGRWYEIASPTAGLTSPACRFQPADTTNTRATYELRPDGCVSVLNETFKADGTLASIAGKAWKNDPDSPASEFTVQFWVPPFLPLIPVRGDYWVMDVAEDYSYALVGQPKREYLWVLSREEELAEEAYRKLLEKATGMGYDVSKLRKTAHLPDVGKRDDSGASRDSFWWYLKSLFGGNSSSG
eukprot:jgi/Tetstr1/435681/TSEL_024581.t1